jgi:hypothetical protein
MEAVFGERMTRLGSTSQPVQPDSRRRKRGRAGMALAFVVAAVITVAWVVGLFIGVRWLVTAIF